MNLSSNGRTLTISDNQLYESMSIVSTVTHMEIVPLLAKLVFVQRLCLNPEKRIHQLHWTYISNHQELWYVGLPRTKLYKCKKNRWSSKTKQYNLNILRLNYMNSDICNWIKSSLHYIVLLIKIKRINIWE